MKTLILMILSVGLLTSFTPSNEELDFSVSFKNNKVIFEFNEGATYSLAFNSNKNVLLNENGMVLPNNKTEIENSKFLIEYSKTKNLITLKGIKGVDWKDLSIMKNRNTTYSIDENGIKK